MLSPGALLRLPHTLPRPDRNPSRVEDETGSLPDLAQQIDVHTKGRCPRCGWRHCHCRKKLEEEEDEEEDDEDVTDVTTSKTVWETVINSWQRISKIGVFLLIWIVFTGILVMKGEKPTRLENIIIPEGQTTSYLVSEHPAWGILTVKLVGPFLPLEYENLTDSRLSAWVEIQHTNTSAEVISDVWKIPIASMNKLHNHSNITYSREFELSYVQEGSGCTLNIAMKTNLNSSYWVWAGYDILPVDTIKAVCGAAVLVGLYIAIITEVVPRTLSAIIASTMSVAILALMDEYRKYIKKMEQDDDILLEGSALDRYLKEQGFNDYEVVMVQQAMGLPQNESVMAKVWQGVSRIAKFFPRMWTSANKDILKPLKIIFDNILESGILSVDDEYYLRSLTEKYNPTGVLINNPLWSFSTILLGMSPGMSIFFVTIKKMHWCIPLIHSGSILFHLLQLWMTDQTVKRCNAEAVILLKACKEYTSMLVKAMRSVRENELIAMNYDVNSACESERDIFEKVKSEHYLAVSYRHSIFFTLSKIIDTLRQEIINLHSVFPKIIGIEHPDIIKNHLDCVMFELKSAIEDGKLPELFLLKELFGIYRFLSALFLRTLGRNLLLNTGKSERFDVSKLSSIISKVSHCYVEQSNIFKDSLNNFEEKSYVPNLSLPESKVTNILTACGISSARNHLMALLVGIKDVESLNDLSDHNIDQALVATKIRYLIKDVNRVKENMEMAITELEGRVTVANQNKPVCSYPVPESKKTSREPESLDLVSSFDPPGQDEVFVGTAVSNSDTSANNEPSTLWEEYDELQRKYTSMISELKIALQLKEEEMRERENRALGIDPSASEDDGLEFSATRKREDDQTGLRRPTSADQSTSKEPTSKLDKDAVHETFQLPHFSRFGGFGTVNIQPMAGEEQMFGDEIENSENSEESGGSENSEETKEGLQ